jgi:hypothetical protein
MFRADTATRAESARMTGEKVPVSTHVVRLPRGFSVLLAVLIAFAGVLVASKPAAAAPFSVSVKTSALQPLVNKKVVLTGTVRPIRAAAGARVNLQIKSGTKWVTFTQARVRADGTFRKAWYFSKAGVKVIRAQMPAKGSRSKGASASVTIKVWRWIPLTSAAAVEGYDFSDVGAGYTNGTLTTRTLQETQDDWFDDPGDLSYSDWSIQRRCSTLSAVVGLDDSSESVSRNRVEILGDGYSRYTRDFALGQGERVSLNIWGVLRLRLQTSKLVDGSLVKTNFGSASVKC